jgi:hypothetical protein
MKAGDQIHSADELDNVPSGTILICHQHLSAYLFRRAHWTNQLGEHPVWFEEFGSELPQDPLSCCYSLTAVYVPEEAVS